MDISVIQVQTISLCRHRGVSLHTSCSLWADSGAELLENLERKEPPEVNDGLRIFAGCHWEGD